MTQNPNYLYKIQPARAAMLTEGPTPAEEEAVGQNFAYLQGLAEAGVVFLAGRTLNTDASSFGIVIFQAADEESAQRIMQEDPAVRQGVMRAELYPYRIALLGALPEG